MKEITSKALTDIAAERQRQQEVEGWTPEHDDAHTNGEMARAAGFYAAATAPDGMPVKYWPWDWSWYKPTDKRRDLIKAAALIVAEIERLDRALLVDEQIEPQVTLPLSTIHQVLEWGEIRNLDTSANSEFYCGICRAMWDDGETPPHDAECPVPALIQAISPA